jgi:L-serine/L-threonine ammonia-lyase
MHHSAFFHSTPLLAGAPLPDGSPVSFKLEFLQPSGSFKDRGIGHMIQTLVDAGNVSRLICSSGGNAGHAVATAAQKLGLPADVFVPSTTLPLMREKIAARGANVIVSGANWNEADAEARRKLAADPGARYIPPFDDPLIWEGNSTLIDELVASCTADTLPSVIVLSVGGGGLLRGVQLGLERHGLSDRVTVVRREIPAFYTAEFGIASAYSHTCTCF